MLKLGAFTDEISQDFEHALEVMGEYGCTGFELRSVWDTSVHNLTDDQVNEVKAIMGRIGFECYNIAGPVFKCDIDSEQERSEHLKILARCIEVARMLNTRSVRAFTFWRKGGDELEERWHSLRDFFRPAVAMAEGGGVTLAVENEHDTFIGSGAVLRRFIDQLGSENLRVIWDPCNVVFDYDSEPVFPDGYEAVKDLICLVHVKDSVRIEEERTARCVPVGEGEAGLKELFKALMRDGYTGYLSLETHWRPEGELSKRTLRLPGGREFSSDAEYASRVCFENMKGLIGEAEAEM
jgi:sugar phosphate isomerase/epimerase